MRIDRQIWLWLVPLLLVMFWLGARSLDADPVWGDERFSIYDAAGAPYVPRTLPEIWMRVAERNPWHAPGYFIVLHIWGNLVGWDPLILRAMSLLFGALAVAWTYRLGRDMVSAQVGLYAAAVLATSAFFIHYLHELRMYSLFALLTAFTVWCYWRIVKNHGRVGAQGLAPLHYLGLLVGAVGMLYIHYFASLPIAAIGLYHLLFAPKNRRWWITVGVLALAGALFLPWANVLLMGLDRASEADYVHRFVMSPLETLQVLAYTFGNGSVWLFVGALLLALWWRPGVKEAWFFAAVVIALVIAVNQVVQVLTQARVRYLMVVWPLLALLVGIGIDRLSRWRPAPTVALMLFVIPGVWGGLHLDFINNLILDSASYVFPWNRVIRELRPYFQPDDAVVVHLPEGIASTAGSRNQLIGEYYTHGSGVRIRVVEKVNRPEQADEIASASADFPGDALRVWSGYEVENPHQLLKRFEADLDERYDVCPFNLTHEGVEFDVYARAQICCIPIGDMPRLIQFGEGITLTGLDPLPDNVTDVLPVFLGWSVESTVPPYIYSVALHVLDSEGNLVAQADAALPGQHYTCQEMQINVADLTAGDYMLNAIVYNWQTGERRNGEVIDTGATGERLAIGHFEVSDE